MEIREVTLMHYWRERCHCLDGDWRSLDMIEFDYGLVHWKVWIPPCRMDGSWGRGLQGLVWFAVNCVLLKDDESDHILREYDVPWSADWEMTPAIRTAQSVYYSLRDVIAVCRQFGTKRLRCPKCNVPYSRSDIKSSREWYRPGGQETHGKLYWSSSRSSAGKLRVYRRKECDGPSASRHLSYLYTAEKHKKENNKQWLRKAKQDLKASRKLLREQKKSNPSMKRLRAV